MCTWGSEDSPAWGTPWTSRGCTGGKRGRGILEGVSPSACISCPPHRLLLQQTDLLSVGLAALHVLKPGLPPASPAWRAGAVVPVSASTSLHTRLPACLPPGLSELTLQGLLCRRTLCVHSLAHPEPEPACGLLEGGSRGAPGS